MMQPEGALCACVDCCAPFRGPLDLRPFSQKNRGSSFRVMLGHPTQIAQTRSVVYRLPPSSPSSLHADDVRLLPLLALLMIPPFSHPPHHRWAARAAPPHRSGELSGAGAGAGALRRMRSKVSIWFRKGSKKEQA